MHELLMIRMYWSLWECEAMFKYTVVRYSMWVTSIHSTYYSPKRKTNKLILCHKLRSEVLAEHHVKTATQKNLIISTLFSKI
jgi:hypothetical protein